MNGGIIDASGSVVLRVAAGMGPTHNDPEMFDTADDAAPSHRATAADGS
jgi:hypothetical protein